MNKKLDDKAPIGPWDAPLKEYNKKFPLIVTVIDLKTDKTFNKSEIDYGNFEHRKFLGRLTFWAVSNGYSVETMSLKDYENFK